MASGVRISHKRVHKMESFSWRSFQILKYSAFLQRYITHLHLRRDQYSPIYSPFDKLGTEIMPLANVNTSIYLLTDPADFLKYFF